MIRVVLWDIDGTLTDFRKAEALGIKNCFRKFHLGHCSEEMLAKYVEINNRYWQALEHKEITKPELLVKRFDEFFALYNISCDSEKFNLAYQEELREGAVANAGAVEAVEAIDKLGISQYVVTNGIVESQYKKLKKIGLENSFRKVFISDEIGYDKPDEKFFIPVFEEIGKTFPDVRRDEIMIIGDSLTSDIQGGINTGIVTCLYNPAHIKGKIKYNIEVDNLKKIAGIIREYKMEENKKETADKKTRKTKKDTTAKTEKTVTKRKKATKTEKKTETVVKEEAPKLEAKETVAKVKKEEPVKEVEKINVEPKKSGLKDIVDTNYRQIIVCLLAIALLFVCLFVGTRDKKNTYSLSEITTFENDLTITLPKKWYMSTDGYAYAIDGKFASPMMSIYDLTDATKADIENAIETARDSYDITDGTYAGYETFIINNLYQGTEDDPEYDCIYMVISDDEVMCLMFMNVEESVEISILNSIR